MAIDRPINKRPLTKADIACITLLAVSLVVFLISIVFICYRGILPDGITMGLFFVSMAGYIAGSIWARYLLLKQISEWAERKQQRKAELSQVPAEDVNRKEIADDGKDIDGKP